LIQLRRAIPALRDLNKDLTETMSSEKPRLLVVKRGPAGHEAYAMFNFDDTPLPFPPVLAPGSWKTLLDSAGLNWSGPGSSIPQSFESNDIVTFSLAPHSASLFSRGGL